MKQYFNPAAKGPKTALTANRNGSLRSRWKLPRKENISPKSEQRAKRYFGNWGQNDFPGQRVKTGSQETAARDPQVVGRGCRPSLCVLIVCDETQKMLCCCFHCGGLTLPTTAWKVVLLSMLHGEAEVQKEKCQVPGHPVSREDLGSCSTPRLLPTCIMIKDPRNQER